MGSVVGVLAALLALGTAPPAARTEAAPRHPVPGFAAGGRSAVRVLPGSFLAPFGRRGGCAGLGVDSWRRFQGALGAGFPTVDLVETDKEYRITAELPGMAEKVVELTLANGVLTLKGEKWEEREKKDYHAAEGRYGSFRRSLHLPEDVDGEPFDATCNRGRPPVSRPRRPRGPAPARCRRGGSDRTGGRDQGRHDHGWPPSWRWAAARSSR